MNEYSRMCCAIYAGSLLALGCAVSAPAHAQQHAVGATAFHMQDLEEHEFHDHAFRERDYQEPRFFDSRHHHDHYYPPVGSVFGELPPDYRVIPDPDGDLYFADGAWYREQSKGRYVVVAPEVGIRVPGLPPHYTTVMMSGVPYYYANNTYYLESPSGYLVVDPALR
jgi:hypothetical protein